MKMKKAALKIKLMTPYFRVSFANVFKPRVAFEGQEAKYSVQMLFPKEADLTEMKKAVGKVIRDTWGGDKTKWPKNLRLPFKSGDEKKLDGYQGMTIVDARSKTKPGIIAADGKREIIDESEFYSGCWARATVTVSAYNLDVSKGVNVYLQNLQKWKDDKAFSGRTNPKDDFGAIEELESDDFENAEEEKEEDDF